MVFFAKLLAMTSVRAFRKRKAKKETATPSTHRDRARRVPLSNAGRVARLPVELLYDILEELVADSVDFLVTHVDHASGAPLTDLPGPPPVMLLWVSRALRRIATKTFAYALVARPDANRSFASNPWLALRPIRAAYLGLAKLPPGAPPLLYLYGAVARTHYALSYYPKLSPIRYATRKSPAFFRPIIAGQTKMIMSVVEGCVFVRASMRVRILQRARKSVRVAAIVVRLWMVAMMCRDMHQTLLRRQDGTHGYDATATSLIAQIREATLEEESYLKQVAAVPSAGDSGHRPSGDMLSKAITDSGIVPVLDAVRWCPDAPDSVTLEAHAALERWAVLLPELGIRSVLIDRGCPASPPTKPLPCFHSKREVAACMFGQARWLLDRLHSYADDVASRKAGGAYGEVVRGLIGGAVSDIGRVLDVADSFLSWQGTRFLSAAEIAVRKDLALLKWKIR